MPDTETRAAEASWRNTRASGYAAVFNTWTTIAGLFEERILPGAFKRTLVENPDVLALWHHRYGDVLGRTSSGSLVLREDGRGLHFELEIDPRSPVGAHALTAVERGDVRGCSYGFRVTAETWDDDGIGLPRRTITEADLFEITVTPTPAFPTTSVSLRTRNAVAAARRIAERKARMEQKIRGIR